MAALLAIISSFFYALTMVLARFGLKQMDSLTGGVISMVFSLTGTLIAFAVVMPVHAISSQAILFFALAGLSGPCLGRLLLYVGINRVGSAIASSLYAIKPLFAALGSLALLGEIISPAIGIGIVIIIAGLAIISSSESGTLTTSRWSKKDLLFPILAGAGYGLAHVFRKLGLNINAEPVLGLLVQNTAALLFPLLITCLPQSKKKARNWQSIRGWTLFGLAGLSAMVGQLSLFAALTIGKVVIVAPLSTISPLFVLLIFGFVFQGMEKITWKLVTGALLILAATTLLTVTANYHG